MTFLVYPLYGHRKFVVRPVFTAVADVPLHAIRSKL